MALIRIDHHHIHNGRGNADGSCGQFPPGNFPSNLENHLASGIVCRGRHCIDVQVGRLFLQADVSVFVCSGAFEQSNIHRQREVSQVLLAIDGDAFHQGILGGFIHPSSILLRIDEGSKSHMGDQTGALGRDFAHQLHDHSSRQHIGFDFVFPGKLLHSWGPHPVPTNHSANHSFVGKAVHPP